MLLGDRSFVDREEGTDFQKTGVFHVLVLAGLHVGALAFALYWAGRRLRGWLTAAGLVPEGRCVVVLDATEWGGDTFIAHNWPHHRRALERAGRLSAADLDRFESEIGDSVASGAFYWSVVRHAWRARVPS